MKKALIFSLLFLCSCSFLPVKKVAIVNVVGLIEPESAREVLTQIHNIEGDDQIVAVVLRVDSPGGAVAASQEIFSAIKRLDKKKPVIASMGTLAASGGYYVSLGARKIYANPGTVTGSIGVRMDHVWASGLMKKIGVGYETLKTGKLKNLSPVDRPLSPEEKKFMEGVLDQLYVQFVDAVATSRKMDKKKVKEIADGRIISGEQAKKIGLIDDIGGLYVAVAEVGKLAGIEGRPKIYQPKREWSLMRAIFGSASILKGSFPAYVHR